MNLEKQIKKPNSQRLEYKSARPTLLWIPLNRTRKNNRVIHIRNRLMALSRLPFGQIHLVLFMGVSICLHCDSAPTVSTATNGPSSQPACQVLLDVNIIHDSTCLQNDFQDKALLLGNLHASNEEVVSTYSLLLHLNLINDIIIKYIYDSFLVTWPAIH